MIAHIEGAKRDGTARLLRAVHSAVRRVPELLVVGRRARSRPYGDLSAAMAVFFAPVDLPPEVQRTVARGERPQGHDLGMPPQPCLPGLRWLSLAIAHR
jgi:hypothetical protein